MSDRDGVPNALAVLLKAEFLWQWKVDRCPRCNGVHVHGGGPIGGNPRERLGYTAAPCGGTYLLKEDTAPKAVAKGE